MSREIRCDLCKSVIGDEETVAVYYRIVREGLLALSTDTWDRESEHDICERCWALMLEGMENE